MQELQETRVRSLGQEDPLQEGLATHSSILARRIPWTEEPWGHKESDRTERLSTHTKDTKELDLKVPLSIFLYNNT